MPSNKKPSALPVVEPVQRRVSVRTYVLAFLITSVIFVVGLYLGSQLQLFKSDVVESQLQSVQARTAAFEFLTAASAAQPLSPAACQLFAQETGKNNPDTRQLGKRLEALERSSGAQDAKVIELKNTYFYLEARDYYLLQLLKNACGAASSVRLYFYSNTNCPACSQAATQLEAEAAADPSLSIYSFDLDYATRNAAVRQLADQNNVKSAPAVIEK